MLISHPITREAPTLNNPCVYIMCLDTAADLSHALSSVDQTCCKHLTVMISNQQFDQLDNQCIHPVTPSVILTLLILACA